MFHNNYKVYQTGFCEYGVEVEFWNFISEKVETLNFNKLNEEHLNTLIDLLTKLDFDNRTPDEGE